VSIECVLTDPRESPRLGSRLARRRRHQSAPPMGAAMPGQKPSSSPAKPLYRSDCPLLAGDQARRERPTSSTAEWPWLPVRPLRSEDTTSGGWDRRMKSASMKWRAEREITAGPQHLEVHSCRPDRGRQRTPKRNAAHSSDRRPGRDGHELDPRRRRWLRAGPCRRGRRRTAERSAMTARMIRNTMVPMSSPPGVSAGRCVAALAP
jgi:hypothetical protein